METFSPFTFLFFSFRGIKFIKFEAFMLFNQKREKVDQNRKPATF